MKPFIRPNPTIEMMNPTPKGKIGRLPKAVREELNRRLQNGEKGRVLVAWLNSLPAVQAVLAAEFDDGKPLREQNLSEWRKHGYQHWLWRQEAREMMQDLAAETGELSPADAPPLADQMAGWVTVRYLMAMRKLVENSAGGEPDLKTLREFLHDVVAVRRGDHSGARLKIEQERLEREREKTEEEVIAHFQGWLEKPAVRDLVSQNWISPEERERRLREIFGRAPRSSEPPESAAPGGDGSNPVKPGQTNPRGQTGEQSAMPP
jgi:hypothetical protein